MTSIIHADSGYHHLYVHDSIDKIAIPWKQKTKFTYTFYNHFHPYVAELLERLNRKSIDGLLDVNYHATLVQHFFQALYAPTASNVVDVEYFPKNIDLEEEGPYANYNWELLFHVPLTIAVHLSKNQRFAEAQRWFHYIFDPTSNDKHVPAEQRFWKFLRFRQDTDIKQIDELLALLSKPDDECTAEELERKNSILSGYEDLRNKPFQPHAVARTRHLAYRYCVVFKYLDNLVAWGDSLFRQDTIETINEATQLYVLAANILGERPQRIPQRGMVRPKTFAQLRVAGLDDFANALVELEGQFPFNLYFPTTEGSSTEDTNPLFGIGRTLYFCIPRNDKLLGYWDLVADRLFKIRHCMNIEGVVRQLPLFEPPIDPGMLVKAAAAGIDISSLVSGLNQPLSPIRSSLLIQKALEICNEVRGMGNSLLSALEKRDGEALALMRQRHEITIQQLVQDVRFLQWKEARESSEALLKGRATMLERYRHYQRLLGKKAEESADLDLLALERPALSEENFDEVYNALVGQYALDLETEKYPPLTLAGASSPATQSQAAGTGKLFLSALEAVGLNVHLPKAKEEDLAAFALRQSAPILGLIPQIPINIHFWGIGGTIEFGGDQLSKAANIGADILAQQAGVERHDASTTAQTGSFERRTDDHVLQSNLAARELMQVGRQIIASLIREQIARHEYENVKKQIEQAQELDEFLRAKFTNEQLYGWMQGELSKLFYEYYKFAFDIARKAEQTMKHELLRPELDELSFIKFNYWDGGRKGLLSGEALHLDLKRMELAYHDHNKREYELTKHVSLRQLDPLALLALKATGTCEVALPEWLFDLDAPGHYMRRIKSVSLSIPAVTGPYSTIHCTLSLLNSSLRKSPLLSDGEYGRQGSEDGRFVDYYGTIQSVVTSSGTSDSGLFETNLREERFLPFEGAGALSLWKLELPEAFRQFDYNTISDVVLHVRYTARQGGGGLRQAAVARIRELVEEAGTSGLVQLFSLRHDFPSEWYRFVSGEEDFSATVQKRYFPYFVQSEELVLNQIELVAITAGEVAQIVPAGVDLDALTTTLEDDGQFVITLAADDEVLLRDDEARVFLLFRYSIG